MQNFQDTFETREWSFISAFSICMIVRLRGELINFIQITSSSIFTNLNVKALMH